MARWRRATLRHESGTMTTGLTRLAGCGGHEVRTWVAAYAAMNAIGPHATATSIYRDIPQWNAGMGIAAAELASTI
jgi:2,3-dihydroxyphenylpropionate 1,2-dioxygenase